MKKGSSKIEGISAIEQKDAASGPNRGRESAGDPDVGEFHPDGGLRR